MKQLFLSILLAIALFSYDFKFFGFPIILMIYTSLFSYFTFFQALINEVLGLYSWFPRSCISFGFWPHRRGRRWFSTNTTGGEAGSNIIGSRGDKISRDIIKDYYKKSKGLAVDKIGVFDIETYLNYASIQDPVACGFKVNKDIRDKAEELILNM